MQVVLGKPCDRSSTSFYCFVESTCIHISTTISVSVVLLLVFKLEHYEQVLGRCYFSLHLAYLVNHIRNYTGTFMFQIDKKLMQTEGMVARVRKEVEIHSRLKHPSILEVRIF